MPRFGRVENDEREFILTEVSDSSAKVECQKSRKDIARLADDGAKNLIVKNSVTRAQNTVTIIPEAIGRVGETDSRSEVVQVRIVDSRATVYEFTQSRNQIE